MVEKASQGRKLHKRNTRWMDSESQSPRDTPKETVESTNEDQNVTHLFKARNDGLNTSLWIQKETDRSAEWSNILSQFQMRYNSVHFAKEPPCDCL